MREQLQYDVAIVGGGLAGLALSIQCAKSGYKTILFEKENYPFHKVCGEYISFESWNFLEELGVSLSQMNLPVLSQLEVTAPNGKKLEQDLPLGGFGISRYKLDALLAQIARQNGVNLLEGSKVTDVNFENDAFIVKSGNTAVEAGIVAGTFGKRSNLDIKWKRRFINQKPGKLNNYVAVKYHVKSKWPSGVIALHNFKNGYCGISRIEDGRYCLCYLTTARNLESCQNSIPEMERNILSQNPHLRKIFSEAEMIYDVPVTISQISFAKKTQMLDHILMIGDAAGMITPLCGNGMSMALHGSKIAFEQIHLFCEGKISRQQMELGYTRTWRKQFGKRLKTGRIIQRFFGNPVLSNILVTSLKRFPRLTSALIRQTHGQPF